MSTTPVYELLSYCKFDLACTSCLAYISVVQLMQRKLDPDCFSCLAGARLKIYPVCISCLAEQVRSGMYQQSSWHNLDPVCIKPELSCRQDKGHRIQSGPSKSRRAETQGPP